MSYVRRNWVNDETELSAENMNYIENGIYDNQNIEIIAYSEEAPADYNLGDRYYNSVNDKIYIATETGWESEGEPLRGPLYLLLDTQTSFYYNGETLVSVGGGTDDIFIQPEQPETEDWKIWIDTDEINSYGSEVVNSLEGNETALAPSVKAVNDKFSNYDIYSNDEIKVGTWIDGKPIYRRILEGSATNTYNRYINTEFDYDFIVDMKVRFMLENDTNIFFDNYARAGVEQQILIGGNNTAVVFRGTRNYSHYWITLEYTKTTD